MVEDEISSITKINYKNLMADIEIELIINT